MNEETNIKKDINVNEYLSKNNYKILIFWETDINNNINVIKNQIIEVIE
jgi:very-short-patch-repair endonuclease